jgi:hypothetical protein
MICGYFLNSTALCFPLEGGAKLACSAVWVWGVNSSKSINNKNWQLWLLLDVLVWMLLNADVMIIDFPWVRQTYCCTQKVERCHLGFCGIGILKMMTPIFIRFPIVRMMNKSNFSMTFFISGYWVCEDTLQPALSQRPSCKRMSFWATGWKCHLKIMYQNLTELKNQSDGEYKTWLEYLEIGMVSYISKKWIYTNGMHWFN